jgi:hypothetical protein
MVDDVVVYAGDEAGAFAPAYNASKPTGGSEVHAVQLCEGLGAEGLRVVGVSPIPSPEVSAHARYLPDGQSALVHDCRALITMGLSPPPRSQRPDRHVVLFTHDAPHNVPHLEAAGLRWSEFVCVSQWQASRFPRGWKTRVIPPIVDDAVYSLPAVEKDPKKFVCVSAWWKGTQQTLEAWSQIRPPGAELHIGSPYSHPPNARSIVERVPGCVWIEPKSPRDVIEAMRPAIGVFRVCMQPETFGITDVIGQIVGCRIHALCPNGLGGMSEALHDPSPWVTTDGEQFAREFHKAFHAPPLAGYEIRGRDLRASRIIPMWRELLDL